MHQPNGASYEFFENLLPPLRYVNSDFRYYPLVLSAPNAKVKARLISNGSGINLRGGSRSWNEVGTPIFFRVGPDEFKFGDILNRLQQPTLADGYLPIPEIRYAHATEVYKLEAFAATEPNLASNGVVMVKFSLASGTNGTITVDLDARPITFRDGKVADQSGAILAYFDESWTWERQRAHAKIATNKFATLAIYTKPVGDDVKRLKLSSSSAPDTRHSTLLDQSLLTSSPTSLNYEVQRERCVQTWESLLNQGMSVETPEPLVNHAWKNLIIQNFFLISGDRMNYSAGNQYEKMYAAESSDSAIPLMWWGFETDFRRLLPVILDITDKRLPYHFACHKLDDIPRLYWQTRDLEFIKQMRPRWQMQLDLILTNRSTENGLLPKENYCTDIEVPVYSFNSQSKCWAALRDMAPVLDALGDHEQAQRVREAASEYKQALLKAIEKNIHKETDPPFVPMAMNPTEDLHDPITETRLGSYWDLVANYAIGSRIFAGTDRELWIPRYFETHGGLCMGLTRSAAANHTFWTGKNRTNPLYGMRYILDALRRDDVERALVSFYGMLAHGMTRNTFAGAEGASIETLDEGGRYFYCPPNSSSNGQWLAVLRHLLVQDLDEDNDGEPETLRLLFGTPRRWLEDGKSIIVERAPTAFGQVSVRVKSNLAEGNVVAEVQLPERNTPKHTFLRIRLPEGWKTTGAKAGTQKLQPDAKATVDLTNLRGKQSIRFDVAKR
jgi:hypothetical protein